MIITAEILAAFSLVPLKEVLRLIPQMAEESGDPMLHDILKYGEGRPVEPPDVYDIKEWLQELYFCVPAEEVAEKSGYSKARLSQQRHGFHQSSNRGWEAPIFIEKRDWIRWENGVFYTAAAAAKIVEMGTERKKDEEQKSLACTKSV